MDYELGNNANFESSGLDLDQAFGTTPEPESKKLTLERTFKDLDSSVLNAKDPGDWQFDILSPLEQGVLELDLEHEQESAQSELMVVPEEQQNFRKTGNCSEWLLESFSRMETWHPFSGKLFGSFLIHFFFHFV